MLTVNVYIIVIYDVITVDYCKCILLYSPLNSYLYVHWTLNKYYYYLLVYDLRETCSRPGAECTVDQRHMVHLAEKRQSIIVFN